MGCLGFSIETIAHLTLLHLSKKLGDFAPEKPVWGFTVYSMFHVTLGLFFHFKLIYTNSSTDSWNEGICMCVKANCP